MSSEPAIVFEWDGETELDESIPRPTPASRTIPDWYKKLPTTFGDVRTVKLCSSFSDALRAGWVIPFPFDLSYLRGEETLSSTVAGMNGSVEEYDPSPITYEQNSSFRKPEFKVDMPWKIHTPDGYSALITYPLNRLPSGLKPFSMLVDTDSHDGSIPIPAVGTKPKAEIEKGEPFLQVIPIKRDAVLSDFDLTHSGESPDVWDFWEQCHEPALSVHGFYRRFCWEPKPGQEMTDLSMDAELPGVSGKDDISSLTQVRGSFGEPEHTTKIACEENDFDLFPEPTPASEYIPEWIENPETPPLDGEEDKQLLSWIGDAMNLGWIMPIVIDAQLHVEDNNYDLNTPFKGQFIRGVEQTVNVTSIHSKQQMGPDHPETPSVLKIMSPWFTVTPPGYSTLCCEPLNHMQHIIESYAGFVDSDRYMVDGNLLGISRIPDGEYTLSAGEPGMVEIPIHRESLITNAYITD